jgi:hypothetical protein
MIEHLTKETFREKVFDFKKYSEWKYDEVSWRRYR